MLRETELHGYATWDELPYAKEETRKMARRRISRQELVSTIQIDFSCPEARLAQSLKTGTPYEDAQPGPDVFVTLPCKQGRMG